MDGKYRENRNFLSVHSCLHELKKALIGKVIVKGLGYILFQVCPVVYTFVVSWKGRQFIQSQERNKKHNLLV